MTFQQLLYVVTISQYGSINKAAQKMFISQSAISSAVADLEQELQIELFRRSNRGVDLTSEGREFLNYANSLLEQKKRIETIYSTSSREKTTTRLSVASQRYPFTEDAFVRFIEKMEMNSYSVNLKEEGLDFVIDDVYDGYADVGIVFISDDTEKMIFRILKAKNLEFNEIISVEPCAYVRQGHPLTKKEFATVKDIQKYPFLSFDHHHNAAAYFAEEVQTLATGILPRMIYVTDRAAAINVIIHSDAVSTGSGLLAEGFVNGDVTSIPLKGYSNMRLGWIHKYGIPLSEDARTFVTLLENCIQDSLKHTEKVRRQNLQK